MKNAVTFLSLLLGIFFTAGAQNTDLGLQKRWNQLMQLNPALTSYTGEFRTLVETGAGVNLGLEAPVFKSKWNTGAFYLRESVPQLLRNRVNLYVSRVHQTKKNADLRFGMNGSWVQKSFFELKNLPTYRITDFNGHIYDIDSTVKSLLLPDRTYFDAGIGLSYRKKNILIGLTARNLLQPDISIVKDLTVKQLPELGMQLGGFVKRGEAQWFPVMLLNIQDGAWYGQMGLSYLRKTLSIGASYEQWESVRLMSMQLNYRKGPLFLSFRYAGNLAESFEFDSDQLQVVINLSILRKRGLDEFNELLRKMN